MFQSTHLDAAFAALADPTRRGRTYGVVGFVQMMAVAVAPLFGGILLDTVGEHHITMWLAIAAIGALQALCFLVFVRRKR